VDAAVKPDGNCPDCGEFVEIPGIFRSSESETPRAKRDCPGCSRPLIWFKDAQEQPEGWMVDSTEERRRSRRAGA
jgi:endogenous inhibitor of DNA gyrase (YacG/DUF329 family)